VEDKVRALLSCVDGNPLEKVRPCDIQKLVKSLKLRKACGLDGIPNECLRHFLRRPLVYLTHLFNRCLRPSHFPKSWKVAKIITLLKPGTDPEFTQNLRPISILSTTGKLFEKVILKIVQRLVDERGLCKHIYSTSEAFQKYVHTHRSAKEFKNYCKAYPLLIKAF
jgi:hypothetical protein